MKSSSGNALLRAAIALGFLGCLVAEEALPAETATREPNAVFGASVCQGDHSDSVIGDVVEIGQPDDFGGAFEDPGEMLRVDIQRQRTFGIDRVEIAPKAILKAARNTRPNISPPLLV
ncbi:MAG: hypothetical protein V7609_1476 [Verrucomicrobiota bacterium]